MAAGILFKNLVVLLALPVILIFSVFYKKWGWSKNKYFWWGLAPAVIILVPWHIVQSARYGAEFWNSYLVVSLFNHIATRVGGSGDYLLYPKLLWQYHTPWTFAIIGALAFLVLLKIWKRKDFVIRPDLYATFVSAALIILGFSVFKSHLSPYILPAYPFLAMFLALAVYDIFSPLKDGKLALAVICLPLLAAGAFFSIKTVGALVTPLHYEERDVGLVLKRRGDARQPVYALDWPFPETINYYGNSHLSNLLVQDGGKILIGPFYLVTNPLVGSYFYNREGALMTGYENLRELYRGQYLVMFYSDKDLTLPPFSYR